jgi:hypothetical protein
MGENEMPLFTSDAWLAIGILTYGSLALITIGFPIFYYFEFCRKEKK